MGARELPPPAMPSVGGGGAAAAYAGRPLRGATSAALYLGAEREMGYPPRVRDSWRFPAEAGGALDVHLVMETREALKRPSWPDRAYPMGHASAASGAGSALLRSVALAANYDEGAAAAEAVAALHERTLRSLARSGAL
jgi:hypothetical protein